MASRSSTVALVCLGVMYGAPAVRGDASCGFVAPCVSLFQRSSLARSTAARMTLSKETEAVQKPYSELPADWRSPLQGDDAVPEVESERAEGVEKEQGEEGEKGEREEQQRVVASSRAGASVRTPAQVLQDATRVTPSAGVGATGPEARRMASPPGIDSSLQTENQRRRALPLSKLKRVKPKRRVVEEVEGEYRPLLAKTDRESVLRGEDYWIDYKEVDAKAARKEARTKAPAPDQFSQSKMKAEIVNPYKQNWILVISIAIVAITVFVRINPGILDDPSIITFPSEL